MLLNPSIVIRILVITLGVIAPLVMVPWMLDSRTGAVGPMILFVGAVCAIAAVVKPKLGLYLAAFQVIYLDYFKKIAVYYGEVSQLTIIQVLVVSLVTITAVYLGIVVQATMQKTTLSRNDYILFAGMGALTFGTFVLSYAETKSLATAAQVAVNISIFAGLVVAMPRLLLDDESLIKFFKFVVLCIVPWAFMGLKQYFFGYSAMEWFYAETFLSPVASWQFFVDLQLYGFPRTIGFGSGSVNYGVVGLLLPLTLWIWLNDTKHKVFWAFCSGTIFIGMMFSLQRFATILPFVGVAFYFFTKSWRRVALAYSATIFLLFCGIAYSDFIKDRLNDINSAIASDGKWAGTVLRVSTFGDRLNGWERLKDPSVYSLLGRFGDGTIASYRGGGVSEYHDVLNVILETFGVIGLLIVFAIVGYVGFRIHKTIFDIKDLQRRSLARILIAAMVPIFVSGMLGGANFHTNPFNFIMWMHIGGIYCLIRFDRELDPMQSENDSEHLEDSLYSPEADRELSLVSQSRAPEWS